MGMFDFLKKEKAAAAPAEVPSNTLLAIQDGEILPVEKVPDPVFARKVLGDGYAVNPVSGKVLAPASGTIIDIQDTLHAYGIETEDGLELVVHIGIDTVELKGEGLKTKHKVGDKIRAGELLATVDLNLLERKNVPKYTMVIITNMEEIDHITLVSGTAKAGTPALTYEKK